MNTSIDRRRLLTGAAALGGCALLSRPSLAAAFDGREDEDGPTLVLLQLSGGNDGLSTVVPYPEDGYARARRTTRFLGKAVLRLDDHVGLHPNLRYLRGLHDGGRLAVVQGVGYPEPNRSHFKSMDIWHTASPTGRTTRSGWVGRLCERGFVRHHSEQVVHVGDPQPYSLYSRTHPAASFRDVESYRFAGQEDRMAAVAERGAETAEDAPGSLRYLRSVLLDASRSSVVIRDAVAAHRPAVDYPRGPFGGRMRTVGALVQGGIGCRVVSVEHTGYDTHVSQRPQHDRLMAELDEGLEALVRDLSASEAGRRTVIVVFSEFGRRVKENSSGGTDHGAAGPMFVLGAGVRGGLHGRYPSLDELDEGGDLVHTTDFRAVYAGLIEGVFGLDSEPILDARYEPVPLFA